MATFLQVVLQFASFLAGLSWLGFTLDKVLPWSWNHPGWYAFPAIILSVLFGIALLILPFAYGAAPPAQPEPEA